MWDAQEALRSELRSFETLQWSGRPGLGRMLVASAWPILFMLFWEGMVLWSAYQALTHAPVPAGAQPRVLLPPLLMAVAGLWLVRRALQPVLAGWRMAYGITERRIIVVSALPRRRVQSFAAGILGDVTRQERSGGFGDVVVSQSGRPVVSLLGVPDVARVAALVARIYHAAQQEPEATTLLRP